MAFVSLCRIALAALPLFGMSAAAAHGQVIASEDAGLPIERIEVIISNPSADAALNARVEDLIRKNLRLFPTDRFSRTTAEIGLARARRMGPIDETRLATEPGAGGALVVTVEATLAPDRAEAKDRGFFLTGEARDLPVLYDRNGTFVTGKLELLSMVYANDNAWYGQADPFLTGNPLLEGKPAGEGQTAWAEGFLQAGIYGITPMSESVALYGGFSGILSGSTGRELFTDQTRLHFGVEDAFVGLVGGNTSGEGNRLVWNISAGRKRYAIGDGFLIANSAFNGHDRAALQSNPRWAADMLVLGQVKYNSTLLEAFYLDPDELPVIDSHTRMAGLNFETVPAPNWTLGATYINVLDSETNYFRPAPFHGRDGLEVYDLRARYDQGANGLFAGGEAALQRNGTYDVRATGVTGEVGYRFGNAAWRPEVSYRIAQFSGDDPGTSTFERWDPLLSGGNGEQWVQGINHFKLFQNSNLIAHRLQLRFRPTDRVELVPQFWLFKADSKTNIGGNPALTFLDGDELAYEANLTAKWFASPNMLVQGHIAATFPGSGTRTTLGSADLDPWISAMVFVRIAF